MRVKGLCYNYLRKGHTYRECRDERRCDVCQRSHHTLLHWDREDRKKDEDTPVGADTAVVNTISAFEMRKKKPQESHTTKEEKIAMPVIPVKVLGRGGMSAQTYALLDTGSEESFMTQELADKLNLRVTGYGKLAVCTMSGESSINVGRADVMVEPVETDEGRRVNIKNIKVIEGLNIDVSKPKNLSRWKHLEGIEIPEIRREEVSILIGANVPEAHIQEDSGVGRPGEPYGVKTILGWCIMGPTNTKPSARQDKVQVNFLHYGNQLLDQQMEQFLGIEKADTPSSRKRGMSVEDHKALKRMEETTRVIDGCYEVSMLWKDKEVHLPNNRAMAEARM